LAVADGHGSPKSFRSDVGAFFAVDSAVSVCSEFLGSIRDASASVIKNSAEQQIPRRIIDKWKQKVDQHFNANPFSPDELKLVAKERYPVAYGSTILLAAISDQFLLFFQLGDGEMLVVSDRSGEVARPIPRDEALIANETTSLCMEDPLPEFRFRFQYVRDTPPGIILLSTDGYPNSFRSQEDFLKVGTDLLGMLRTDGGDSVEKDLPGWLQEASNSGSGDDVTLGIVYRLEPPLGEPVSASSDDSSTSPTAEQPADSIRAGATPASVEERDALADAVQTSAGATDLLMGAPETLASGPEVTATPKPVSEPEEQRSEDSQSELASRPPQRSDERQTDDEMATPTKSGPAPTDATTVQSEEPERPTAQQPSPRGLARILRSPFSLFRHKE
jgi:hypothetical protein